ncbi:alpha-1,2-fucosyltransferase [bacterium]|nr:alpha-1,2-fucosyltransferase [bacterium]
MSKLIVRLKGGLGNQLFQYAAAYRLAQENDAELVVDTVSGFVRDKKYKRTYVLTPYPLSAREATPWERLSPFERPRRAFRKRWNALFPFEQRNYIEAEGVQFDPRLLTLRFSGELYLDGQWQSELYFRDYAKELRDELRFVPPQEPKIAPTLRGTESVAVHLRWFESLSDQETFNMQKAYYTKALNHMRSVLRAPQFYIFSDNIELAKTRLADCGDDLNFVVDEDLPGGDALAIWTMSQCKHFIIANSTFSWWGAWLSDTLEREEGGSSVQEKIVISPSTQNEVGVCGWGFEGLIPEGWLKVA